MRLSEILCLTVALTGCGARTPPAQPAGSSETASPQGPAGSGEASASQSPSAEASGSEGSGSSDSSAESEPESGIPTSCHKGQEPCLPGPKFAERVCADTYPSVALYLFSKAVPFAHGYLTRKTKAWNASGGVSGSGYVAFDEEVVVLRVRESDLGGMQVSGAGTSYDAMRWDGTCVTLSGAELAFDRPPNPKATKIEYRYLEDRVQDALREDEALNEAYITRKKECKGAVSGKVSLKCVKADTKLNERIVEYVRTGGSIPVPKHVP